TQVGPPLALFTGPSFPVEFAPQGHLLAIDATRAVAWQFTSRASALTTVLPLAQAGPTAAEFTANGADVITVNQIFRTAHRWRASDGADLGPYLDAQIAPVRPMAFSHGGGMVATNRPDGTAGLFDASTGAPLAVLDAHQHPPLKLDWSPTAPLVSSASDDLSLVVWDVSDPHRPKVRWRLQMGRATD